VTPVTPCLAGDGILRWVIEIRAAQIGDDAALAAIDVATWSVNSSPAPPRAPGAPFFKDPSRVDDLLVAVADGTVVGYVAIHQGIPLASHAHVLEINGFAVEPARQGQGIGRRLLDAAKQEAQRRGATKLSLRVLVPNAFARQLYERAGFRVEGVLAGEFVLDGEPVDDVLMACVLPAGQA
jgi:ribosomal protein S18 acetylase RimI-like enzyme